MGDSYLDSRLVAVSAAIAFKFKTDSPTETLIIHFCINIAEILVNEILANGF